MGISCRPESHFHEHCNYWLCHNKFRLLQVYGTAPNFQRGKFPPRFQNCPFELGGITTPSFHVPTSTRYWSGYFVRVSMAFEQYFSYTDGPLPSQSSKMALTILTPSLPVTCNLTLRRGYFLTKTLTNQSRGSNPKLSDWNSNTLSVCKQVYILMALFLDPFLTANYYKV